MGESGWPKLGVGLPSFGPEAGADAITAVATAAERLGFHAVSVSERLLLPATPGWTNDAGLPEWPVYDPIEVLTYAAACTQRIRLATGIVNALFQPPIVLARRLATLDQLSHGRLDVGLGQGWLPEEFTATGVTTGDRGAGFEEHLAALRACWGPDPVEHGGARHRIPRSRVGPKPFRGHLPVFIGAVAPSAIARAARLGDGFVAAVRDWDTTEAEIATYRAAGGTGTVVARAFPGWLAADDPEVVAAGAIDELARAEKAGADELHLDPNIAGLDPDRQIALLEAIATATATTTTEKRPDSLRE